jgi:acyl carrier protein
MFDQVLNRKGRKMELKEFIENFAEAIDAESVDIGKDTIFKDHPNWDSMAVLSVIAMVDEYYGKILTGDEIESAANVEELFKTVLNK